MKRAVKSEAWENLSLEESPVGEHQSNGEVENAVRRIQGMIRTIRDGLESRYQMEMTGEHEIVPWMIRHAAQSMNRCIVKEDGKTPYQNCKGRPFRKTASEFGECVRHLRAASVGKAKFDSRWEEGMFIGVRDESNEVLIGTSQEVVKAWTINRKGEEQERWNREQLVGMRGTPWEPIPGREGI